MSRSLGDRAAHQAGVSYEPEIDEFTLTSKDKILVLASDGVWEFLSNEVVTDIVTPFFGGKNDAPEDAANALVNASYQSWKDEEDVVDDITCVIIFLDL
jgi:serine/threonine protein phosphatase PrpC